MTIWVIPTNWWLDSSIGRAPGVCEPEVDGWLSPSSRKFLLLSFKVITNEEAERRGKEYDANGRTYLFDLDYNDDDCPFTVDAGKSGNISHFVNHSVSQFSKDSSQDFLDKW